MADGRQRLLTQLRSRLVDTWRGGWQPADLYRLGRRHLEAGPLALLGDAVVDELGRYAPATVDPRWRDQLTDLELDGWWPEGTDFLAARAVHGRDAWRQVEHHGWAVLRFLSSLPPLERLGPIPGEATSADATSAAGSAQADERVLAKVRALLAKAESTTFEAEAEAFTAAAQKLMARHSIDAAMLAARAPDRSGPQGIRLGVERPYESPKAMLLTAVAEANRCRTVWSQPLGFATVVGFPPDLGAVETLFTSLLVQATAAMRAEGSRRTAWGQSRTRSFRQSFLTAYAVRIGERLEEVTQAEVAAASGQRASDAAGPGTADAWAAVDGDDEASVVHGQQLVPVLAERTREVEEATHALFPQVTRKVTRLPSDAEGWWSGRDAADRARLTGPAALGRSTSR